MSIDSASANTIRSRSQQGHASARDSDRDFQKLFIVGCGRSGTTWLQSLLAQHPAVVTSRESKLFSSYLSGPRHRWWQDQQDVAEANEKSVYAVGLPTLMDRQRFLVLCRQFANGVYETLLDENSGASVVLDKTPTHVHEAQFILDVYPDARFIHLVRDPRAVVNSQLRAGEGWGHYWAPVSPVEAGSRWKKAVESARRLEALTDQVRQVRYEDLHADGVEIVRDLWEWLGIETSEEMSRNAYRACSIDQLKQGELDVVSNESVPEAPSGFYRKGITDSWKEELTRHQIGVVESMCGDMMESLGYKRTLDGTKLASLRVEARLQISDAFWGFVRFGKSVVERL